MNKPLPIKRWHLVVAIVAGCGIGLALTAGIAALMGLL
jgi:hypothetical protein